MQTYTKYQLLVPDRRKCGYKNEGLKLSDRQWTCPVCGMSHDRDLNAARNILRRGIDELASAGKPNDRVVSGGHA